MKPNHIYNLHLKKVGVCLLLTIIVIYFFTYHRLFCWRTVGVFEACFGWAWMRINIGYHNMWGYDSFVFTNGMQQGYYMPEPSIKEICMFYGIQDVIFNEYPNIWFTDCYENSLTGTIHTMPSYLHYSHSVEDTLKHSIKFIDHAINALQNETNNVVALTKENSLCFNIGETRDKLILRLNPHQGLNTSGMIGLSAFMAVIVTLIVYDLVFTNGGVTGISQIPISEVWQTKLIF